MAIAFDATASGNDDTSSTMSWNHTCTGSNLILVVGVSLQDASLADRQVSPDGITYNGVALTQIIEKDTPNDHSELWYLINPATGTHAVSVTTNGACSGLNGGSVSLTGVDQTNPVDASNSGGGTGTAQSLSLTTVADNAWIVDTVAISGTGTVTMAAHTGRTQRWNGLDSFSEDPRGAGSTYGPISPAGATTVDWSTGVSRDWALVAASFAPVAVGSSSVSPSVSPSASQSPSASLSP